MRWTDILLCKDKRKIKGIYYESFPSKERMPWAMMLFLSMLPTTKFKAIYDDEKLCGFIYFTEVIFYARICQYDIRKN